MSRPDVTGPLIGRIDLGDLGLPGWCLIPAGLVVAAGVAVNFLSIFYAWWRNRMRSGGRE